MSSCMASTLDGDCRSPFAFFDAIWCVRHTVETEARLRQRWQEMGQLQPVGLRQVVSTPEEPRIGLLASHRRLIEDADANGFEAVLVFDDQAIWHERASDLLAEATAELARQEWDMCVLGGHARLTLPLLPGCRALGRAAHVAGLHALAYHRRCFSQILADWPAEIASLAEHVKAKGGLDAYVAGQGRAFAVLPPVSCRPDMLPFQPPALQHAYTV